MYLINIKKYQNAIQHEYESFIHMSKMYPLHVITNTKEKI